MSVSTTACGRRRRMASTVSATRARPPSARSSRATRLRQHHVDPRKAVPRPRPPAPVRSRPPRRASWCPRGRSRRHHVQRSPRTMKVAVPSAQQSDRLGQPASSHTVTRPSSRTVRFSAQHLRPSGAPWAAATPACGWRSAARLRLPPAPTGPAGAATHRAPPCPLPGSARENADRSLGRCRQATSWRSSTPPAQAVAARPGAVDHLRHRDVTPSASSEVTALPTMPQGMM